MRARAGHKEMRMGASGCGQRLLRDLRLLRTPTAIIIARPRPECVYPAARAM